MRIFVLLSFLSAVLEAQGDIRVTPLEQAECAIHSGEAMDDLMDASLFLWAATKRCGREGETIKCTVDVLSTVESVNAMVNVILKVLDQCQALNIHNKRCVEASSILAEHASGLAASVADVMQKCPKQNSKLLHNLPTAGVVMCTMDVKNTLKNLAKSIKSMSRMKEGCIDPVSLDCSLNALDIAGALSAMGEYLAGAIGQCSRAAGHPADSRTTLCTQGALNFIAEASDAAEASMKVVHACRDNGQSSYAKHLEISGSLYHDRLYSTDGEEEVSSEKSTYANVLWGAFLPVAAVVGFASGRFYGNRQSSHPSAREYFSDTELQ